MLLAITCPKCNITMSFTNVPQKNAYVYEDCVRKCFSCRLGASNTDNNPTYIYENMLENFPIQLRDGLEDCLKHSLNEINKPTKGKRMAYTSSEDALTWIFFKYFSDGNNFNRLKHFFKIDGLIEDICLWGSSILFNKPTELSEKIRAACINIGEDSLRLSEPDVAIKTSEEVCFIEVKFKSGNSYEENMDKYELYNNESIYRDYSLAKNTKLYELIRNWTIGNKVSGLKKFRLINLGPRKLFKRKTKADIECFRSSLNKPNNFQCIEWEGIFETILYKNSDKWLIEEIEKRFRLTIAST